MVLGPGSTSDLPFSGIGTLGTSLRNPEPGHGAEASAFENSSSGSSDVKGLNVHQMGHAIEYKVVQRSLH